MRKNGQGLGKKSHNQPLRAAPEVDNKRLPDVRTADCWAVSRTRRRGEEDMTELVKVQEGGDLRGERGMPMTSVVRGAPKQTVGVASNGGKR